MTSDSPAVLFPVTVVGGTNMDISATAHSAVTAGDSTPGAIRYSPGGVGRNIAENLARLGVGVQLVTVVGDDAFGQQLTAMTAATGVGVDAMMTAQGQRTATYLSMHQPDGEVAMAVNDMEILETLTPEWCARVPVLQEPQPWLLVDCNVPQATLSHLLGLGRTTVVDGVSVAKCRRLTGLLPGIYLLKLNHLEAAALSGLVIASLEDCAAAVEYFLASGVQQVMVSFGASGLAWGQAGAGAKFRRARKVPVLNSTGAGDALLAGVVAALQKDPAFDSAIEYGVACAEITLSSTFANSPDLTDSTVRHHMSLNA
ncbi:carbohydrate kinase family protein [Rhodoferax sp.]|uniref:carbohydrate kinase family protein n=1 Tax=Rhodoferax sp. TaxID=50421 RepID=UPI0025F0CE08|nr:carbohydrate kinase family protein [Rhodoferax sp.]